MAWEGEKENIPLDALNYQTGEKKSINKKTICKLVACTFTSPTATTDTSSSAIANRRHYKLTCGCILHQVHVPFRTIYVILHQVLTS